MGEAKRRKEQLGSDYGKEEKILPWLPVTKRQSEDFVKWTTRGAWIGIFAMISLWVTVRFIGPGFGWWDVAG
jgi:fatty acid desaturase